MEADESSPSSTSSTPVIELADRLPRFSTFPTRAREIALEVVQIARRAAAPVGGLADLDRVSLARSGDLAEDPRAPPDELLRVLEGEAESADSNTAASGAGASSSSPASSLSSPSSRSAAPRSAAATRNVSGLFTARDDS